jgi:hypothetical protein
LLLVIFSELRPVPFHDHWLPAAFLARFSSDTGPTRERRVWVRRRGEPTEFRRPVSELAAESGLYMVQVPMTGQALFHINRGEWIPIEEIDSRLGEPSPKMIDELWSDVEDALPAALDALCDPSATLVPARAWLTFGQFFADMFVRGPDFDARLAERVGRFGFQLNADTALYARAWERQSVLAAVLRSSLVLRMAPRGSIVTSDRGFAMGVSNRTERPTYAVSLSASTGVMVQPYGEDPAGELTLVPTRQGWMVDGIIRTTKVSAFDCADWNELMWLWALDDIYGYKADIRRPHKTNKRMPLDGEMLMIDNARLLGMTGPERERNMGIAVKIKNLIRTPTRGAEPIRVVDLFE